MNVEEIMFKLGIRTDAMSQGIQRAKAEVTNLGEHLEKKMSPKAGEGLKNLFTELTSMSPALGNAMQLAFNPIVGGFAAAIAIFTTAKERLKEWNTELDKQGDLASKPVGRMREALVAARDKATGSGQEFAWWEKDLLGGKPGEVEQEAIRRRLEEARVASGGDPIKMAQMRMAILEEERAKAEAQKSDALTRARELQQTQEDVNAIATGENRKAKIQDRLKEEERLATEIKLQEDRVRQLAQLRDNPLGAALGSFTEDSKLKGTEFDPAIGIAATGAGAALGSLIPGLGGQQKAERDAEVQRAQEQLEQLTRTRAKTIEERKKLEEADLEGGKLVRENAHNLKETQAEADKAKQRSLDLDKAIDAEKKALFEAERKRREEDTDNAIKTAEKKAGANKLAFVTEKLAIQEGALKKAQKAGDDEQARKLTKDIEVTQAELETETINKQKAQEKFERDYAYQQARMDQSRLDQDQITVDQLAAMPSWSGGFGFNSNRQMQGFQHQMDRQFLAMGGGEAGKYSDMARDYQLAQEESQMALLVGGKDSDRYKKAKLREESLQAGLGESGIVKVDVSMMKMAC